MSLNCEFYDRQPASGIRCDAIMHKPQWFRSRLRHEICRAILSLQIYIIPLLFLWRNNVRTRLMSMLRFRRELVEKFARYNSGTALREHCMSPMLLTSPIKGQLEGSERPARAELVKVRPVPLRIGLFVCWPHHWVECFHSRNGLLERISPESKRPSIAPFLLRWPDWQHNGAANV
jgi:hypothetical protein